MSLPIDSALSAQGELDKDSGQWNQLTQEAHSPNNPDVSASDKQLSEFFETVAPKAKRFAMSMTRRWCEAEELVQEAFLRMAQAVQNNAQHQSSEGAIRSRKSYLFTTIRNLAIDKIRKSSRQNHEARELDSLVDPGLHQQHHLEQLESAIATAMNNMQSPWADALKLKINGELTYAEIAQVLDATTDQVRGWLFRARKNLANELKRQGLLESNP